MFCYNFIMNRLEEIFKQGRLLFVDKVRSKYVGDKIRVFKPSVVLRSSLALAMGYAAVRTF